MATASLGMTMKRIPPHPTPPPIPSPSCFLSPGVDVKHMAPLSPARLHFITLRQHFPPSSTKADKTCLRSSNSSSQSVSSVASIKKKKVDACVRKDRFKCRHHRVIRRPSKWRCFCFRLSRKFFCVGFLRRWPTNMVPFPSLTDGAFSRRRIKAWVGGDSAVAPPDEPVNSSVGFSALVSSGRKRAARSFSFPQRSRSLDVGGWALHCSPLLQPAVSPCLFYSGGARSMCPHM